MQWHETYTVYNRQTRDRIAERKLAEASFRSKLNKFVAIAAIITAVVVAYTIFDYLKIIW